MGSDLWRFLMDLRLVDVRGCLFSAHPLFSHLISGMLQFSPSLGERQTIFTAGSFSSFCSIKTYKTQPVSDDCQVNQKFFPPPLSSVSHQIGESLISRLCGSI